MNGQVALPESQEDMSITERGGRMGGAGYTAALPKLQLFILMYMSVVERINGRVLLPFIVQMVKETGITHKDVTKVGYYTGLVESATYLADGLLVLQWGRLSDHIGRRPVLFMGLFGMCISTFCLGISHTYWAILASRAIYGGTNSAKGVVKTVVGELTNETNMTSGFALLPLAWAIGGTISPLIGGMLQHPCERFGGIFRHSLFWREKPYFLPCAITVLLTLSAIILSFFSLKETAPRVTQRKFVDDAPLMRDETQDRDILTVTEHTPLVRSPARPRLPLSIPGLLTPRVRPVVLGWAVFGCVDVSFDVLQSLILSTPIAHGGLGMSPAVIGVCLAGFGIVKGVSSALFFPCLFRRFGPRRINTVCIAALFGCYALLPVMNALARINGKVTPIVWAAYLLQLTLAALPNMAYNCFAIYLTAAARPSVLGATNGLCQSVTSFTRCFGPASATALYALSIRYNLLGGNFIYVVMCSLVVAATMISPSLPDKLWDKAED